MIQKRGVRQWHCSRRRYSLRIRVGTIAV